MVTAYTQSDVNATKNKSKSSYQATKMPLRQRKETILNEIADLDDKISEIEGELEELNTKIKKVRGANCNKRKKEIEKLKEEFEEMQQLLTDRLVAIYEEGTSKLFRCTFIS